MSPPPATVIKFLLTVNLAASLASLKVPSPNGGVSKAPTGPFQSKVLTFSNTELILFIVLGPISKAIISDGTASEDTISNFAFVSNFSETTRSKGKIILQLFVLLILNIDFAISIQSFS